MAEALSRSAFSTPFSSHSVLSMHGFHVAVLAAAGGRLCCGPTPHLRATHHPRAQMQSDSRPTREYMDFLLGRSQNDASEDGPSTIVGSEGRIGTLLRDLGQRREFKDMYIKRGDLIPPDAPGPVYICTANDHLDAVVASCPDEKREDLVFIQNGQLEPFRQKHGLYETTQAVLWLALPRVGGRPVDGVTPESPEGLSSVSGKWAQALAQRLERGNLKCTVYGAQRELRRIMLERLVWTSSFMLLGSIHGGITVGEVSSKHREEVEDLIRELAAMCRFTLSVALKTGLEERLCAYSTQVEFLPTSLKEFEWTNGWFYKYSLMAGPRKVAGGATVDFPDSTPFHTELLMLARDQGLIAQSDLDALKS